MKKNIFCSVVACQILCCGTLMAQENAAIPSPPPQPNTENHTVIQINQPYVSQALGELTLPFMWEVQMDEHAKRLTATETRTERPARLTIDLMAIPKGVNGEEISRNIIQSVAENLNTTATIHVDSEKIDCGKSKCPKLTFVRSTLEGTENGTPRRCALELVPSSGQVAILSICTHAESSYEPALNDVVHQVFKMMK